MLKTEQKLQVEYEKIEAMPNFLIDEYDLQNIYNLIENIPNNLESYPQRLEELVLYFLAINNESESLLYILEEKHNFGYAIAKRGMFHIDREARWQVAVLLGAFKDSKRLHQMIEHDSAEYVRRRALLELRLLDTKLATDVAIRYLYANYEYSRMIAIDTLFLVAPSYVEMALDVLKNDNSWVVKNRIEIIKEKILTE